MASTVAFNVSREKTNKDSMAALSKMYKKTLASNKVFLMKKLFNLKMAGSESVVGHLNKFNALTSQLEYVEINFKDEIRALILLSSMPEAWDGIVMAVSNSCGIVTLKFDDVLGVLISEEALRKSSGSVKTSVSVLSVDRRGRSRNRDKKKNRRSKSKSGKSTSKSRSAGCWRCGEMGHIQKDCKQKDGEGKGKEKDSTYITESDRSNALILLS